jgi:hypothetical protein
MRPFWIATGWTRMKLMPDTLYDCDECHQLATWSNAPSDGNCYLCDQHVPIGCSCHGEDRPCVEYMFSPYGWP